MGDLRYVRLTNAPGTGRKSRKSCRGFQCRTVDYLERSIADFCYIFQVEVCPYELQGQTCSELCKSVKDCLSRSVSSAEEVQMAYQSIKKGLPDSCRCMESEQLSALIDKLSEPSRQLPPGYLAWLDRFISRLFPKAWDTNYFGYAARVSPPLSACVEEIRAHGGALRELTQTWTYDEYLKLATEGGYKPPRSVCEAGVVQSAGKPRPLAKCPAESILLKPLHKAIYGRLSKFPWLLRGDITDEKLRTAGFRPNGDILVSGDYKSATDNLSLDAARVILKAILRNAWTVPESIKEFAVESLSPIVGAKIEGRVLLREVASGQMMGSYLSFPLLCLQNYSAFRWTAENEKVGRLPVIINGDDILFQSSREFASSWTQVVGALGLTVEKTKTSYTPEYGSINSTLLVWDRGSLKVKPTLRFGMLRNPDHPHNLGALFSSFLLGQEGSQRYRAGRVFFSRHASLIKRICHPSSLGFRGALAYRLSRQFGLLDLPLRELPEPYRPHDVVIPPEFIMEVDREFVTDEVRDYNARETAAWKWAHGFRYSQGFGMSYRAELALGPRSFPDFFRLSKMRDEEFRFFLRSIDRRSRKSEYLPFMGPRNQPRTTARIMASIFDSMNVEPDFPPPPYREVLDTGREACLEVVNGKDTVVQVPLSSLQESEKRWDGRCAV